MKKTLSILTIGAAMALGTSGALAQPKFQDVEMISWPNKVDALHVTPLLLAAKAQTA